jgi:hypothetical protein
LEIINGEQNSIEDADDTYFPTVEELMSFKKDGHLERGLSGHLVPQAVDELAVEKRRHFGNPNKSTLGENMNGSQGGPMQPSSP